MKLVAISDVHLDAVTCGVRRFGEGERAMHAACDFAIEKKVDLFLFGGDLCDPDSGPIVLSCADVVIHTAERLRKSGIPSVWVVGNHDVSGDGGITSLDPLLGLDEEWIRVIKGYPQAVSFGGPRHPDKGLDGNWGLVGFPYPSSPKGYPQQPWTLNKFPREKVIVAAHLTVPGIIPGEESSEMSRGKDVYWPMEEVEKLKPVLKLGGHHHRRQVTPQGIHIIGAPMRFTHGEEWPEEPGFLYVEHGEVG